ncbi:MAG TPA: hypothetical protein VGN83_18865 [Falsiroseomonas sp.]|jgi:hypothetical protein|nr:hypothetical protein [Falsiroseomonas sp.]
MEVADRALQAARWLAEAVETGHPLGPLPPEIAPRDFAEAEAAAAAVLEVLGIDPCGLRLLRRPGAAALAGPMVEGRLLPSGAQVSPGMLRHPLVTAAAIGVLAEPLEEDAATPPVFARLHPALDISVTRFTTPPAEDAVLAADLARLGLVVAGKGRAAAPGEIKVALGAKGSRPRGLACDLGAAFAEAAAVARRWGGLPAGALLVAAGLTPPVAAEGTLRATFGALGGAEAVFG